MTRCQFPWGRAIHIRGRFTDPLVLSSTSSWFPWLLEAVCCRASLASSRRSALCKSSSSATAWGLFILCHLRNLSNGPARVKGNSLIRLVCTPSMKCVSAMASTSLIHRDGRYCSFRRSQNSWRDSWWMFTLIATFHLVHQSARAAQKIAARKHTGSWWDRCSSKNLWYATLHCVGVLKPGAPCICGQLYSTDAMVALGAHLCLLAQGQNLACACTAGGGSNVHAPLILRYTMSAATVSVLERP